MMPTMIGFHMTYIMKEDGWMDGLNDDSVGIVGRSSMKPYLPRIFSTGKSHLESRGIVSLFVSKTNQASYRQQQHAIQ